MRFLVVPVVLGAFLGAASPRVLSGEPFFLDRPWLGPTLEEKPAKKIEAFWNAVDDLAFVSASIDRIRWTISPIDSTEEEKKAESAFRIGKEIRSFLPKETLPDLLLIRAVLAENSEKFVEAKKFLSEIRAFEEKNETDSEDSWEQISRVALCLGRVEEKLGNAGQAENQFYKAFVYADPSEPEMHRMGKRRKARFDPFRAERYAYAASLLGKLYFDRGSFWASALYYRKAFEIYDRYEVPQGKAEKKHRRHFISSLEVEGLYAESKVQRRRL